MTADFSVAHCCCATEASNCSTLPLHYCILCFTTAKQSHRAVHNEGHCVPYDNVWINLLLVEVLPAGVCLLCLCWRSRRTVLLASCCGCRQLFECGESPATVVKIIVLLGLRGLQLRLVNDVACIMMAAWTVSGWQVAAVAASSTGRYPTTCVCLAFNCVSCLNR